MDEAKKIREEYKGKTAAPAHAVKMNQIITEVPFGDGTINAHLDTSGGEMEMEIGHIDGADLTVTLDYATAKAILVDGNPQAGMQAFMAGKIKVQGDMTKMMAMQSGAPDPTADEIAAKIKEITAGAERSDVLATEASHGVGLASSAASGSACEGALRGALGASGRPHEQRRTRRPAAATTAARRYASP